MGLVSVMTKIEPLATCPCAACPGNQDGSPTGGWRIPILSWAGVGRIWQRFDFSNRRSQSVLLENIRRELRHDRIGPNFGVDALDLDQELRRLLNEFRRIR